MDLLDALCAIGDGLHDDLSIAHEAAREIERLRAEVERLREHHKVAVDWWMQEAQSVKPLTKEVERLREERDYYRRDNEKLHNALAWEHNESENAMDAKRYRWLKRQASTDDYDTRVNVIDDILAQYGERWDALIDAAMDGK